jgi:predicted RNA methylase
VSPVVASRHELGQWFTPPDVARIALALAMPADPTRARVIDPACGDGAFLAAARAAGVAADRLYGVEVDNVAATACAARLPEIRLHRGDLFELPAPDRGYDAVVGNPPYVRQERLAEDQKARVRARLRADWPDAPVALIDRLVGRGDLAAAVVLRALRLARPGARVALVVSSALLDAGYAGALWALVGRYGRVAALVDAPRERWFADAAVNAIILVLERAAAEPGGEVAVARLRLPTGRAAELVRGVGDLARVAELRAAPADRPDSWSSALRACDAWFELSGRAELVPLGELAEVRRGITSGANEIFYLSRARAAELAIEPALLAPLVRAPGPAATIAIDPAACRDLVFAAPADLSPHPRAAAYVAGFPDAARRTTLASRQPWWSLPVRPARLFLGKAYAARFVQRLAPRPLAADQRVYALYPRPGVSVDALAAVLNSSYTALAIESLGRASMGEGALEQTVSDARALPVVDPRRVGSDAVRALTAMAARPIGDVASEAGATDRRALDRACAPALADLLPAIHRGLIDSVTARAARARSAR